MTERDSQGRFCKKSDDRKFPMFETIFLIFALLATGATIGYLQGYSNGYASGNAIGYNHGSVDARIATEERWYGYITTGKVTGIMYSPYDTSIVLYGVCDSGYKNCEWFQP